MDNGCTPFLAPTLVLFFHTLSKWVKIRMYKKSDLEKAADKVLNQKNLYNLYNISSSDGD